MEEVAEREEMLAASVVQEEEMEAWHEKKN
jgi:hypothetical protein